MASGLLRTSDIAQTLGVHVNTVRNYEKWGYLPEIPRGENGYRAFTAVHLEQARLACLVLQWPYLGERAPLVQLVQSAAQQDFGTTLEMAYDYLIKIRTAYAEAETAVQFLEHWVSGRLLDISSQKMTVSQAAEYLDLTVDMLRNWERNGLIVIPRQPSNQYRLYGAAEFARLRVIRRLVQSGFSLMAISRMLSKLTLAAPAVCARRWNCPEQKAPTRPLTSWATIGFPASRKLNSAPRPSLNTSPT
jgi:DNA-binding transcriptional MerR regulator